MGRGQREITMVQANPKYIRINLNYHQDLNLKVH